MFFLYFYFIMAKQANDNTGIIDYPVHTYADLLSTLETIEKEENELRSKKIFFVKCGGGIGVVLVGLALIWAKYSGYNGFFKLGLVETITSYGSAISLGPVFGFMYYSTQAEILSNRKQQFWRSLGNLFETKKDERLDIAELKKLLEEKLKEKLNENLKYEH